MTKDQAGTTYTFDPWNRMMTSSIDLEKFTYDADSRRPGLSFCTVCSATAMNSYYDTSWQDLEDDTVSGSSTTKDTYVWSQSYIDDMVARDEGVNGGAITRIYAQQDANHDVTALLNSSGMVLERLVYDPYGTVGVLTSGWANTSDSYNWVYRFQGGRFDGLTGLYNFRTRDYNPTLGAWAERDPFAYGSGPNVYEMEQDAVVNSLDPFGLQASRPTTGPTTGPAPIWPNPITGSNGTFSINFVPAPGKKRGGVIGTLTFTPSDKCPKCKNIKMVQLVRPHDPAYSGYSATGYNTDSSRGRGIEGGYHVDDGGNVPRGQPSPPYYQDHVSPSSDNFSGTNDGQNQKPTSIWDHPSADPRWEMDFETYAVCADDGTVLGGVKWGFTVSGGNPVPLPAGPIQPPYGTYNDALKQYNRFHNNP